MAARVRQQPVKRPRSGTTGMGQGPLLRMAAIQIHMVLLTWEVRRLAVTAAAQQVTTSRSRKGSRLAIAPAGY